ncbi:MAG: 50S ribosomal protein L24e [Candidatus Thorarchaeota archaeon]|nr:50S ribosomal protein L24e [Candidatus Thorarchaeota archaeon]
MVGTQKCVFCSKDIEPGTGMAFVRTKDGAVLWFCSNKCKVASLDRGKKPRDTKWTAGYEKGGKAARG